MTLPTQQQQQAHTATSAALVQQQQQQAAQDHTATLQALMLEAQANSRAAAAAAAAARRADAVASSAMQRVTAFAGQYALLSGSASGAAAPLQLPLSAAGAMVSQAPPALPRPLSGDMEGFLAASSGSCSPVSAMPPADWEVQPLCALNSNGLPPLVAHGFQADALAALLHGAPLLAAPAHGAQALQGAPSPAGVWPQGLDLALLAGQGATLVW